MNVTSIPYRDPLRGSEHVRQIEASYTLPGVLERLDPHRYDNIVPLASERLADEENLFLFDRNREGVIVSPLVRQAAGRLPWASGSPREASY